jgi:hypothetical protein
MIKKICLLLISWKAAILGFALLSTFIIPLNLAFTALFAQYDAGLPYLVWIWGNFDGVHYLGIAAKGYELLKQPFFPLFPLMTSVVSHLFFVPVLPAALVVSHLCFFASLAVMWKLLQKDKVISPLLFLMIILTYPTSFFYGSVYNDSPFLLFACLTILFCREKKWGYASIFGALATLTRLNGLALAIYILSEYFLSYSESLEKEWNLKNLVTQVGKKLSMKQLFSSGILAVSFIPLSFISYLGYIQYKFGDWQTLFTAMSIWHQENFVFPLQVAWRYLKILALTSPVLLNYWVALFELAAILFYIFILIISWKKIRLPYWIMIFISLLIPAMTGSFQGMPRYALHLYPLFLAIYLFIEKMPRLSKVAYFIGMIILQALFIGLFTRGYFIS